MYEPAPFIQRRLPPIVLLVIAILFSFGCGGSKATRSGATRHAPPPGGKHVETGVACWYGSEYHGKKTASGEKFDMNAMTAAHRTLPFDAKVRVTDLENNTSVVVRINDRGPFVRGRIIDVSRRAAQLLGFEKAGLTRARIELLP